MHYESFAPSENLKGLVKEYWIFENEDSSKHTQKIIPDGFSEIIIHYGDPYRINLNRKWETQSTFLFSSQISKYFFLENTGKSGMIGIKLNPSAFYSLFLTDLSSSADHVFPLEEIVGKDLSILREIVTSNTSIAAKVKLAESWIEQHLTSLKTQEKIDTCLDRIFTAHGMIEIEELAETVQLSSRQLERLFKKVIGLSPKRYSRIIRFNYIFDVMKKQKDSWVRTALQSGFFDQSHFIKNFKEFTGEEPSSYGFDEVNLANFFLQK